MDFGTGQCAEALMVHCNSLSGATELKTAICIADDRHAVRSDRCRF
jgi:hypothetical protein